MLRRQDIHHEVKVDKPKLQVLSIKKIASNNADPKKPERYRMQLSDGEKKQPSSMLATQLNHLIIDNEIQENGIIQLDRYISNTVNDHRIIIILGVTVVSGPTDLIGNPTPVGKDEPTAAAAVQPKAEPTRAKMITPQASSNNPYSNSRSSSANVAPRGGRSSMAGNIQHINTLTPYQGSRWTIQVRVTNKSERTYSNAKGEGKLFSVDMCDESGEMRGTGFNQDAERLGAIFEVGKVRVRARRRPPAAPPAPRAGGSQGTRATRGFRCHRPRPCFTPNPTARVPLHCAQPRRRDSCQFRLGH